MKTIAALRAALESDTPVLLWGAPGTGKTATITALAVEERAHLEVLIGSTLDPSEVCGVPVPVDGGTALRWIPPAWAVRLRAALDAGYPGWLFLDEISCAPPAVQAALLRVVQDRVVGEMNLHGCHVIAAANPADSAADGGWLPPAMASRWAHIEYVVEPAAWVAGELGGWGRERTPAVARAAASVCAFVQRHPAALLSPPKSVEQSGRAWPSPRTWSAAIRMLAAGGGPRAEGAEALVAACVGQGAATEWSTYEAARDLPDPEELLAGRGNMPTRGDQVAATLVGVVAAALAESPERTQRVERAWAILGGVRPDVAIVPGQALRTGAPEIVCDSAVALGGRIRAVTP